MDLTEFADRYIREEIPDRVPSGSGTTTLATLMRLGVAEVEPIIADVFWSVVLSNPTFGAALLAAGDDPIGRKSGYLFENPRQRAIVVPHAGGSRYDLVVLSSVVYRPKIVLPVLPQQNELIEQTQPWERYSGFLQYAQTEGVPPGVLYEALQEFDVRRVPVALVTSMPQFERTRGSVAIAVRCAMGGLGTVGVAATDSQGRTVLTTAGHVIADRDVLRVAGKEVTVLNRNHAVDAATVSLPRAAQGMAALPRLGAPAVAVRGRRDVPGYGTPATFDGARSGLSATTVTGIDPGITAGLRHTATHVYTPPVTAGGDSGAALLDKDSRLIGFCSERTAADEELEMSTWVWADQVLALMGLTLNCEET